MRKIAVYGSLRKGLGNHRLIEDSTQLSTEEVEIPYKMISLGGFPGLIPSDTLNKIKIELYEVTDHTYRRVEMLEGYPSFYQKNIIKSSLGEVEVYVLEDPRYQSSNPVESGDWVGHLANKYN